MLNGFVQHPDVSLLAPDVFYRQLALRASPNLQGKGVTQRGGQFKEFVRKTKTAWNYESIAREKLEIVIKVIMMIVIIMMMVIIFIIIEMIIKLLIIIE